MLNHHRDISLTAAVDFAAGGGELDTVGHLFTDILVIHGVHDALGHAGGVGGRNVAVQPALGVCNGRDGRSGAADGVAQFFQIADQRFDIVPARGHELDVVTDRPAQVAIAIFIGQIAEAANDVHGVLALGSGAHCIKNIATLGHVLQHAGAGTLMIFPLTVVLDAYGVQHLHIGMRTRLNGFPSSFSHGGSLLNS